MLRFQNFALAFLVAILIGLGIDNLMLRNDIKTQENEISSLRGDLSEIEFFMYRTAHQHALMGIDLDEQFREEHFNKSKEDSSFRLFYHLSTRGFKDNILSYSPLLEKRKPINNKSQKEIVYGHHTIELKKELLSSQAHHFKPISLK